MLYSGPAAHPYQGAGIFEKKNLVARFAGRRLGQHPYESVRNSPARTVLIIHDKTKTKKALTFRQMKKSVYFAFRGWRGW